MKKILKYFTIYAAIGIIITVFLLFFIDRYIYKLNSSTDIQNTTDEKQNSNITDISIPTDAESIQYSYDNKYYTYLKENQIYINTIEDGKNIATITEENPICYYNLLYDKNLILYFTKSTATNSKVTKLKLMTYDILSQKKRDDYNTISVTNFSKIKYMEFSPVINMIYLNVEVKAKSAKSATNTIYKIDLFKSMSTYTSGKVIEKMVMTKNKDRLYYENSSSKLYYNNYLLSIFKEDVDLIGTDASDNVYFINSSKDIVYKVFNNKIVKKIPITDKNVISTYSNNYSIYIIYSSYVINISDDKIVKNDQEKDIQNDTNEINETNQTSENNIAEEGTANSDQDGDFKKLGNIGPNDTFDAIKNNIMYLRSGDNKLIVEDLTK